MREITKNLLLLLGRCCIGILFLWTAIAKFLNWGGTIDYITSRLPFPTYFLLAAALVQLVGGLSLLCGIKTRWGAILLVLFIVPATVIFHDFWNLQGALRITEKTFFMKDIAVFGGLLLLIVTDAGDYSLDRYFPFEVRRRKS